jgi:alkylhydroperoxidase/carboxymuconolactone decarboxylase family protein YurZ
VNDKSETVETIETAESARERIKDAFIAQRGYWRPWVEILLDGCPAFVEHYARYAGHPARSGPLSDRMVELIYVALDASSSHLFEPGLQTHMEKALQVGASRADIFDVLHLVAVQGVSSVCQAAAILAECAGRDGPPPDVGLQQRMEQVGPAHSIASSSMAALDPAYAEVLMDFIEHGGPGTGLTPAESSLVQLALHACFTAFNPDAVRQIVTTALSQGLTTAALSQAIQMGAHLAVHGAALGANVYGRVAPTRRLESESK